MKLTKDMVEIAVVALNEYKDNHKFNMFGAENDINDFLEWLESKDVKIPLDIKDVKVDMTLMGVDMHRSTEYIVTKVDIDAKSVDVTLTDDTTGLKHEYPRTDISNFSLPS